ncbi:hypothetical protein AG0111_0g6503 [Alternaria gaisen]|uniref:Uncharacterized protein n=1 Tax=Alternaria gaisen TaxID=167740 RepID=A0ACB6FKK0_9PLEO|nr:hypothetical protein AG0111_0g6503 [Alternaria gaisen]
MASIASKISWTFPYGGPTDLTLPASYTYNTTRYAIEEYLSTYQSDTDAPRYMHGKDIVQSSWSGIDTTENLNLGIYCLTCTVQGDQDSHACLDFNQADATEVWIDVGVARERMGSDVEMPTGNDGRPGDSQKAIRNRDFACVFQMQQNGQDEGTSISDIILSMGDVTGSPNFWNATYRNGQTQSTIDAEQPKPFETGPLMFTFPGAGNLSGLNSDATMKTYLEHALHNPNTQYWGDASSLKTMPEAEDLIEATWTTNPNMDTSNVEPLSMMLTCLVCLEPYEVDPDNDTPSPASRCNDWANAEDEVYSENTKDNITETRNEENLYSQDNTTASIEIAMLYPSFFDSPADIGLDMWFHKQPDTMLFACALALTSGILPPSSTSYSDIQEHTAYSQVFFATQPKGKHTREQHVFSAANPGGVPSGRQRAREAREEEDERQDAEAAEEANHDTDNPGTKAGIAIGVVLGVGMAGYLAWVWWRKRKNARLAKPQTQQEEGGVADVAVGENKV